MIGRDLKLGTLGDERTIQASAVEPRTTHPEPRFRFDATPSGREMLHRIRPRMLFSQLAELLVVRPVRSVVGFVGGLSGGIGSRLIGDATGHPLDCDCHACFEDSFVGRGACGDCRETIHDCRCGGGPGA